MRISVGGLATVRLIANCCQGPHIAIMAVQITIRNVPEEVRDELAARAARDRKSMQEYLKEELERLVARPSIHAWLEGVRARKRSADRRLSTKQILKHRDADRR
jgi:plasmid stability protein